MAECHQSVDVVVGPCGQHQADRRHECGGEAPPPENKVDQGPTSASVAVREGVERLELSVGDGGLDEG